jgi:DNA-binding LacI/PurR family transcriptional regulator
MVKEVGFVVPRLADLFVGRIVTGAQEVLAENGYHVSVFITKDDVSKEGAIIRGLLDKRVAGIIVHPTMSPYYNPIMYALAEKRVPFVMTGRHYRFLDCSYVEADNARGAYEAVSHLIGLGHRSIGLVSKPIGIKSSAEDRVNGYLAAMADHDLPVRGKLMLTDLPDRRSVYWDERTAEEIAMVMGRLRVYLQSSRELTAVIALNDLIAADIIQAVREVGRTPGTDVSVVGFDNVSLSERLDPSLTTVESPILEMGRAAARVLLDRIAHPEAEPQRLQLPVKLVIRESSKPCSR